MMKWINKNWQQLLFTLIGLVFLSFCLKFVMDDKIADAAFLFGFAFMCFVFSNVSIFKSFKGLGFEAELWENRQKEAENLIQKLKKVITVYTEEIITNSVTAGRWNSAKSWNDTLNLYDVLTNQHAELGLKIDFTELKNLVDSYYILDCLSPCAAEINTKIAEGLRSAMQKIKEEFKSPISDSIGYAARLEKYREIRFDVDEPLILAKERIFADQLLLLWKASKEKLKKDFDVEIEIEEKILERIREIAKISKHKSLKIEKHMILWARQSVDQY